MYPRKYVIVIVNDLELAILFDAVLEHRDFCNSNRHPAAAGFYDVVPTDGKLNVYCYGESVSLKCKSRGEIDANIIKKHFERRI